MEYQEHYQEAPVITFARFRFLISVLLVQREIDAGTIDFLLDDFVNRGCSVENMTAQVTERHGSKFTIEKLEKTNEFNLKDIPLQCFLETYFDNVRGYEEGEPIDESLINDLIGYLILDKKQVVVGFNRKWEDSNNDGFYNSFSHSALLQIVDGKLKLRQSVSVKDDLIQRLIEKNGKNVFWYPAEGELTAELLNQFRELKTGVGLENELCGSPGCLWPDLELEKRIVPYKAVRFYVSKYSGDNNPCEPGNNLDFTKCWVQVEVGSYIQSTTYFDDGHTSEGQVNGTSFTGYFMGSFSNNSFTGSADTAVYNSTVTGSITVELNESRDVVTSVHAFFNADNPSFDVNNQVEAVNIPNEWISTSSNNYMIEGSNTCDHITLLKYNVVYEDRETNLISFECDLGYEHITVYFSK